MPGGRAREGSAVGSSRVRAGPGRGLWWCLSGCGSLVNITGGPQAPAHNSARRSLCGPRGRRRKSDPPLGRRKLHSVRRPNRFGSATRRLAGTLVGAGPNEAPSEAPAAGPAPGAGLQSCVRPAEFVRVVPTARPQKCEVGAGLQAAIQAEREVTPYVVPESRKKKKGKSGGGRSGKI